MQFFFPDIVNKTDWSKPYVFLDTELNQITGDAVIGKRIADNLVKVFLNYGTQTTVYLHIDLHRYFDAHFTSRISIYNRRTHEKYNKEVVSLATLKKRAQLRHYNIKNALWNEASIQFQRVLPQNQHNFGWCYTCKAVS